mmetsp:Transcript_81847/g.163440  ORF Transcript_81847/g.163440 Transcript_81847/m.163440 type:complete len:80 (+) Transcript_81847:155-394(+)
MSSLVILPPNEAAPSFGREAVLSVADDLRGDEGASALDEEEGGFGRDEEYAAYAAARPPPNARAVLRVFRYASSNSFLS